jgi:hexosaminidase
MSHPIIPAPLRFTPAPGRFALRPGTPISYSAAALAPLIDRFCAEVTRRTARPVMPRPGPLGPLGPQNPLDPADASIRIGLDLKPELFALPTPLGVSPRGGAPPDERYALTVEPGQVVLRAAAPVGVARGLTTLIQLLAADREPSVPCGRILDAPRYAWRGLSLDLARTFFTLDEVRRVVDLLALYKLSVLHLHLTDDQAWRLPIARPAGNGQGRGEPGPGRYRAEDLRALVGYAADRFVTVVPEVDMPGHAAALVRLYPELASDRNGGAWLDPDLPATFPLVREVLTGVAGIFPGPYLHIGADEPAMPRELYISFVRRVREVVRSLGKRPVGWQESARAGLSSDDLIQYWVSGIALAASVPPEVRARADANLDLDRSRADVKTAAQTRAPVIVSPQSYCYLDVPYADPPADPAEGAQGDQGDQARQARVGARLYAPQTLAQSFAWDPAETFAPARPQHLSQPPQHTQPPQLPEVAGVEAAVWAETVADFADLSFLLLPRLPGVAHKAWSPPQAASWTDHRDRLARHARLWAQDDLTYFRAAAVDWR